MRHEYVVQDTLADFGSQEMGCIDERMLDLAWRHIVALDKLAILATEY